MGRNSSDHSESPVRNHRSSHRSPSRRKRSGRSPGRDRASRHHPNPPPTHSPSREKPSSHTRSSKQTPASPVRANSRSPSPRSKRLRRDRSNNKDDKPSERGHGKTRSPASHESRSPSPRTRRLRRAQADKTDEMKGRGHVSGSDKVTHKERDSDGNGNGSSKSRHGGEGHRSRHKSDSPPRGARDEGNNSRGDDHQNGNDDDSVAQMKAAEEALATKEKQKPSFELSGKLAAETNRVKGVTLLFTEPPDARKPEIRWRLYVFKGGEVLNEPLYVHRQTCYLFGRERRVADIPTDHPSCSKQHAVLQYRQVEVEQPDGMLAMKIRPYIMDLGSTNGTFINDNRIEAERYYELMEKDTIKFGNSSREYVLLHENSA